MALIPDDDRPIETSEDEAQPVTLASLSERTKVFEMLAMPERLARAERALIRAGYTYLEGAEEWKPPIDTRQIAFDAEINRMRDGLKSGIRAAALALFVIRKQDAMPNSSWESGLNRDLAMARAALAESAGVQSHPDGPQSLSTLDGKAVTEGTLGCQHSGDRHVGMDYLTCSGCGAFCAAGRDWGIARGMWFGSRTEAEFYKKNGYRPKDQS